MTNKASNLAETIGVTPASIAAVMTVGYSLFEQGKLKEAQDLFEGVALLDPDNPYSHTMLGSIHQLQKDFEAAIECYSRALALYPTEVNTLTNRGECNLNLGRLEEAAKDFGAAIELDPEGKHVSANRARFLCAVTSEALKLAQEKGVQAVMDAKKRIDQQLSL
jgi:tetratricopeptide (TPR) repeat protein